MIGPGNSLKKTARLAGVLWLLTGATSAFWLVYVRRELILLRDVEQTASNIASHEALFRLGIGSNLVSQFLQLFFVFVLYRLFKDVNGSHAKLMLTFMVISVAVGAVNTLNNIGAVTVMGDATYLNVFQQEQRNALMMIFLRLNNSGLGIVEIFTGLAFFMQGLLIVQSGFIPKTLGFLLMIVCVAFATNSLTALIFPSYHSSTMTRITMAISAVSVLPNILWLLVKGVTIPRSGQV